MHAQISKMHRQLETFNAIRRKNINDIVYSCPFVSIRGSVQCLLFDCIILNKQLLVFYRPCVAISYYASSGTSPGRNGACGAAISIVVVVGWVERNHESWIKYSVMTERKGYAPSQSRFERNPPSLDSYKVTVGCVLASLCFRQYR